MRLVIAALAMLTAATGAFAQTAAPPAAAPAAPPFATTKVEGTENVYIFRYQNHQSIFIVTPAGVIASSYWYARGSRRVAACNAQFEVRPTVAISVGQELNAAPGYCAVATLRVSCTFFCSTPTSG